VTPARDPVFEEIEAFTTAYESGWSSSGGLHNDPRDKGGWTRWGHAEAVNDDLTYDDLVGMDREGARERYRDKFWDPVAAIVPPTHPRLRQAVYDGFTNGQVHGLRSLQRILKTPVDVGRRGGGFGPDSRAALAEAILSRPEGALVSDYLAARRVDYDGIADAQSRASGTDPEDHPFRGPWNHRIDSLERYMGDDDKPAFISKRMRN